MKDLIDNKSSLVIDQEKLVTIPTGTDLNSLEIHEHKNNLDLKSILLSCQVDPLKEIDKPPAVIEILSGGKYVPVLTLGNFSMIIGKAKSKKTFLIGSLASALIANSLLLDKINGCLPGNQNSILYFDTEQSEYHLQRTFLRILGQSESINPTNFKAYGLRKFKPELRLALIEYAIYNTDNVGVVFIDGGRDLLSLGINDEKQATDTTSDFLRWTAEKNIHLLVVLHQNKNDLNARGHFGTECINKAETTISITNCPNDPEISIVTSEFSRDVPFEPFAFRINETGLPEGCDMPVKVATIKQSKEPDKISKEQHFSVLEKIYKSQKEPKFTELWRAIKKGFIEQDVHFGDNKAKEFITYYSEQEWICKDKSKKVYKDNRMV